MPEAWPPSSCVWCLVTDRQALAAAAGRPVDPFEALREQVAAAVDAGVELVHVRERDLDAGRLRDLVGACVEKARGTATRIVVNDRVDVALAAGARGVHLRADSIQAARVRPILPAGFLVGQALRGPAALPGASGADYLVVGTVFATPSHPGGKTIVGLDGLSRVVHEAAAPVLAIGGITEERLADVARAGAAGVAAIRLFFRPAGGWAALAGRVARWRREFDTSRADFLT